MAWPPSRVLTILSSFKVLCHCFKRNIISIHQFFRVAPLVKIDHDDKIKVSMEIPGPNAAPKIFAGSFAFKAMHYFFQYKQYGRR